MSKQVLTALEKKLIEAMKDSLTVKDAAHKIGIEARTAYTILYRLRKKYLKARRLVNVLESKKRGNELLRKTLAKRYEYREKKGLEEEEEEFEF